jgi:predicted nucleic acid-binding protein
MILIDSNVPMSLVGTAHANKAPARMLLDQAIAAEERLVTDAEVLQEVLHRYAAIRRLDAIPAVLEVLLAVVDEVIPIEAADVVAARDILMAAQHLSARDALRVAIMRRHGITTILTFDKGFDRVPGVRRFAS